MTEKLAEKVIRLSRELELTQQQISLCRHQYSAPTPATHEKLKPIFRCFQGHGSDPEPVYDYVTEYERGWERSCQTCGYTEYTAKTKPIIKEYVPDFSR